MLTGENKKRGRQKERSYKRDMGGQRRRKKERKLVEK